MRGNEEGSLRRYWETIRERRWFVLGAVMICTLAATAYAITAQKIYDAHADMLVTPVPNDPTNLLGLGLLQQASDPTRDVTTASRIIDNTQVAARVQRNLGLSGSPQSLLQKISVDPVANSSIVSITASTASPQLSQNLANGFATAVVQLRTQQLHAALDPAIAEMRRRIATVVGSQPAASTAASQPLYQQLANMEALRSAPDPTLKLETPATLPTAPSSPRTKLDIIGGLIAGLLIGIGGAFALNAFDARRAREGGLEAAGLPVLTRAPLLGRSGRGRHAFDEAFRSLRTTLRFASADSALGTLAVTSTFEKEGKTTTSFQLAMATLEAGQTVLLVEADPFRPGLRTLVGSEGELTGPGLLEYLAGVADLDDIIEHTSMPGLMFIPAGSRQRASITALLEGSRGRSFVNAVSGLADVVILDCPPVRPRSDAVLISSYADAVLVVVDLHRTSEEDVLEVVRRLRRADAHFMGLVLNRDTSASASYEYRELQEKTTRQGWKLPSRR